MRISTRGKNAIKLMLDLATYNHGEPVRLKDIAKRQNISEKYLEQIVPVLTKNGYIEGVHGKGGGYRLIKAPEDCIVGDILRLTEGDLAPVACLECGAKPCERAYKCKTYPMWTEFYRIVCEYFDGKTLADILETDLSDNYSI